MMPLRPVGTGNPGDMFRHFHVSAPRLPQLQGILGLMEKPSPEPESAMKHGRCPWARLSEHSPGERDRTAMKSFATPIIALILALAASTARAGETVIFATVADFPPYNYLDEDGEVRGFEADLMQLLCARAGLACDFQPVPWDELIPGLANGDFDAVLSARELPGKDSNGDGGAIAYSRPYLGAMPAAMLVSADRQMPPRGTAVAVISGTRAARWVAEKGWSPVSYDDPAQAIRDVELGEVAGLVADQAYLERMVAQRPDQLSIAARGLDAEGPIAVALPGGSGALQGSINAALTQMARDGTLQTLAAKWFSASAGTAGQVNGPGDGSNGDSGQ